MIRKILKLAALAAAVYAFDRLKILPIVSVAAYMVDLQRPGADA